MATSKVIRLSCFVLSIVTLAAVFYSMVNNEPKTNTDKCEIVLEKHGMLSVDEPIVNLGHAYRPSPKSIDHSFQIQNTSSDTVKLRVAAQSCTCTTVKLTDKEVGPGEFTKLKITWKPSSQPGPQVIDVYIETDLPGDGPLKLSANVFVKDYFRIDPLELSFGELKPGEKQTKRIELQAPSGRNLSENLSFEVEGLANECVVNMERQTNHKVVFDVSVTGRANLGFQANHLIVSTGDRVKPTVKIPITAIHLDKYCSKPRVVVFDTNEETPLRKRAKILSNIDSTIIVERVVSDAPSVVRASINKDNKAMIEIELYPGRRENESFTGRLEVFLFGEKLPIYVAYAVLG